MPSDKFDVEVAARISVELIEAFIEAKTLSDAGDFGARLNDAVGRTRALYEQMREQLNAADPDRVAYVRSVFREMGYRLADLEWLIYGDTDRVLPT
jgi:hypothetical protein